MMVHWFSRKGAARSDNRDAAGVLETPTVFFAVIVDGGTKGPKGAAFVKSWVTALLNDLATQADLSVEQVLYSMRSAHTAIRFDYPAEIACYTALLWHRTKQKAWCLTCGDCRLGVASVSSEKIDWLNPVHTLDRFLETLPCIPTTLSVSAREQSVVTRCLHARRFTPPQIVELMDCNPEAWVLATDGYWQAPAESTAAIIDDDVSRLTVGTTISGTIVDSDCNNLFTSFVHNGDQ